MDKLALISGVCEILLDSEQCLKYYTKIKKEENDIVKGGLSVYFMVIICCILIMLVIFFIE